MLLRIIIIAVFSLLLLSNFGCVEKAKVNSSQVIHLYTDLPNSLDSTLFDNFKKQTKIRVFVHHASAKFILDKLLTEKYESQIDAVLFRNGLSLIELADTNVLMKHDTNFWQPLFSDPFVFVFPLDSVSLFSSYGQIIRSDRARVDPSLIKNYNQWGNLIPSLKKNYPIYSMNEIQNKILYSDSLSGEEVQRVQIVPYSSIKNHKNSVFPDQLYKGAIGIIGGIGVIRQCANRANALELYYYCQNETWRKKLANNLHLFPILSPEENKSNTVILFQNPPNFKNMENLAE
ncbi:MAG: hypothetical protein WC044_02245 [Crocinitomicaceae bacterium]